MKIKTTIFFVISMFLLGTNAHASWFSQWKPTLRSTCLPALKLGAAAVIGRHAIPLASTLCHEVLGHALAAKLLYNSSSTVFIGGGKNFTKNAEDKMVDIAASYWLNKNRPGSSFQSMSQIKKAYDIPQNKNKIEEASDKLKSMNQLEKEKIINEALANNSRKIYFIGPWWSILNYGSTIHHDQTLNEETKQLRNQRLKESKLIKNHSFYVDLAGPLVGSAAALGMYALLNNTPFLNSSETLPTMLKFFLLRNCITTIDQEIQSLYAEPSENENVFRDGNTIAGQFNITYECYQKRISLLRQTTLTALWITTALSFRKEIRETACMLSDSFLSLTFPQPSYY
jgi:hypothetical protein